MESLGCFTFANGGTLSFYLHSMMSCLSCFCLVKCLTGWILHSGMIHHIALWNAHRMHYNVHGGMYYIIYIYIYIYIHIHMTIDKLWLVEYKIKHSKKVQPLNQFSHPRISQRGRANLWQILVVSKTWVLISRRIFCA